MDTKTTIHEAGQQLLTVLFSYTEADGSNEGIREVEPYSYRDKGNERLFYGFDIRKNAIRSFVPNRIQGITLSSRHYVPRWPVEV